MILTTRELLQLTKGDAVTETNTNYYVNLEDGAQYKPSHHTTHRTKRNTETARKFNRSFVNANPPRPIR